MTITEISPYATVVLDGSGNGQCSLNPPSGTKWALRLATLAVAGSTVQPQGFLYRGSASGPLELVDSTFTGAQASSAKVGGVLYYSDQRLWAVWKGGTPGATATLQIYGQQGGRTDPLVLSPSGQGFDNPIVSGGVLIIPKIIVAGSGGAEIIIDSTTVNPQLEFLSPDGSHEAFIRAISNIASQVGLAVDSALFPGGDGNDRRIRVYADENSQNGTLAVIKDATGGVKGGVALVNQSFGQFGYADTDGSVNYVLNVDSAGLFTVSRSIQYENEGWNAVAFSGAGWANTGGGTAAMRYRLVAAPYKCVQLVGVMTPGTKTDGTVVFTLPAGYRPTNSQDIPVAVNAMAGANAQSPHFAINTNGNVACWGCASATGVSVGGLFSLDA
jgi:hypothetical protein